MMEEFKRRVEEETLKMFKGSFWTNIRDAVSEIEGRYGYEVSYACDEYLIVTHPDDEDETELMFTFGGTERTKYITKVAIC